MGEGVFFFFFFYFPSLRRMVQRTSPLRERGLLDFDFVFFFSSPFISGNPNSLDMPLWLGFPRHKTPLKDTQATPKFRTKGVCARVECRLPFGIVQLKVHYVLVVVQRSAIRGELQS